MAEAPPADVTAYELRLAPDFTGKTVTGDETVRFAAAPGVREIAFSDNALVIERAILNGRPAVVRRDGGRMTFASDRPLGRGTLRIRYRGQPDRGLIFASPTLVYSSYFACSWMICDQDRTGDRASLDLRLVVPKGMTSIATRPGRPVSAYLYGFAAGRLRAVDLPGRQGFMLWIRAETQQDFAPPLASTADMAAFFADKAGVPLPPGGYATILAPEADPQEGSDFSMLAEETVAALARDPTEDWAPAHELAHQWWGGMIACSSWDEMWLNEGFAVFMTAAWKEHRWGRPAYDREMDLARKRWDSAKSAGWDRPLTWRGTWPSLKTRRAIVYSKGALFLDALRGRMGDAAFWRGIRRYSRALTGGVATTRDLQTALQAESPADLGPLFAEWAYPPHP